MASIKDIINFEVPRALKKKSFWYTTLAPPIIVLIVALIEFSSISGAKNTNNLQTQNITKNYKIAVLDQTGLLDRLALVSDHIASEPSKQAGIDAVKNDKIDAFFYYPSDVTQTGISIYAQDKGITDTPSYDTQALALLNLSVLGKVNAITHNTQIVKVLENTPTVNTVTYKNGKVSNSLASLIAPGIFLIAFILIIILSSYLMLTSTTEEKENRVAEIILTSVKSRSLIIGKILSIFILGAIQLLVIIGSVILSYILFRNRISLPGGISLSHIPINALAVTYGALFFVGGLVLFTSILVGFSALFPSAQQAGRYLGLAIIWALLPIYAISSMILSPNAPIVKVFTYFPLTAPTTALIRNAIGNLSTSQTVISFIITFVTAILALLFAIRAFRYGAMEYGRRISIKELLHNKR